MNYVFAAIIAVVFFACFLKSASSSKKSVELPFPPEWQQQFKVIEDEHTRYFDAVAGEVVTPDEAMKRYEERAYKNLLQ